MEHITITLKEWVGLMIVLFTTSLIFGILIGFFSDFIPLGLSIITFQFWIEPLIMVIILTVSLFVIFRIDDMK